MSKKYLIGILVPVAVLTLACLCIPTGILPIDVPVTEWPIFEPDVTEPPAFQPVVTDPSLTDMPACIADLTQILDDAENVQYDGQELDNEYTLVTYTVSGDTITDPEYDDSIPSNLTSYQEDYATHAEMWQFFVDIIPAEQRTLVTNFVVFTDGVDNTLGAVEQTDDPHNWMLEMDIEDASNFPMLSTTLVHEFAHLLTLNDAQVPTDFDVFYSDDQETYDQAEAACPNYFMVEGCSNPDSYINVFYDRFWLGVYDEWLSINTETDQDVLDQQLEDFYDSYYDEFVSWYAVTSPEEDIAESFMYFIFTPMPSGATISDQKILFFYEYPELVSLRQRILDRLCHYVGN